MIKKRDRLKKFDRVVRKLLLPRTTTGANFHRWMRLGCLRRQQVRKVNARNQEDFLYDQMSQQRDKENYIFSVFMYLLRIAFMLD